MAAVLDLSPVCNPLKRLGIRALSLKFLTQEVAITTPACSIIISNCDQLLLLDFEALKWDIGKHHVEACLNEVQNAIEYLKIIGALDANENLTVLGRYMTMLSMEPKLGKMLINGVIFNCLDPISTVIAGLSVRDPFLAPMDKKDVRHILKQASLQMDI